MNRNWVLVYGLLTFILGCLVSGCCSCPKEKCNPCQRYDKDRGCVWVSDSITDSLGVEHCIEPIQCGGRACSKGLSQ